MESVKLATTGMNPSGVLPASVVCHRISTVNCAMHITATIRKPMNAYKKPKKYMKYGLIMDGNYESNSKTA